MQQLAALVLAGGRARRFGSDKTRAPLAGRPLLEHAVSAVPPGVPVIVVGPPPADGRGAAGSPAPARPEPITWTREVPPYGGPAAALAAGCAVAPSDCGWLLILAADQPFAADAVRRLIAAGRRLPTGDGEPAAPDGVVAVDPAGRRQPLLAIYRRTALSAALGPAPAGRAVREVVAGLRLIEVPVTEREALDVDAPVDLARAQQAMR